MPAHTFFMALFIALFSVLPATYAPPCNAGEDKFEPGMYSAPLPDLMTGADFMAVPGQTPCSVHPKGTLILARALFAKGVTLTEWDLQSEKVVREGRLGWLASNTSIVRSGDTLHVASATPRVHYAAANAKTLQVEHQVDLGPGDLAQVASDGTLTVVSWSQLPTWHLAAVDSEGRIFARFSPSVVPKGPGAHPLRLAVVNGHAYALVGDTSAGTHLLKLSSSLVLEKDVQYPTGERASLAVVRGHLIVDTSDGFDELSTDLDVLGQYRQWSGGYDPTEFTSDEAGRIVTNEGQVFLNPSQPPFTTFVVDYEFGTPMPPLWVGDIPVLLFSYVSGTYGYIEWVDLSNPRRVPPRRLRSP
jgi:hypothetical protein